MIFTEDIIADILKKYHIKINKSLPRKVRWCFLRHVQVNFSHDIESNISDKNLNTYNVDRYIDAFVMNCYKTGDMRRIAYEIKCSFQDFKKEIQCPAKSSAAKKYVNEFYFVAPVGIIPLPMIPQDSGLIEVSDKKELVVKKVAPVWKVDSHIPVEFLSSILRNISK